jgi:hypothetical protein
MGYLTTWNVAFPQAVTNVIGSMDITGRRRKNIIDKMSALCILQVLGPLSSMRYAVRWLHFAIACPYSCNCLTWGRPRCRGFLKLPLLQGMHTAWRSHVTLGRYLILWGGLCHVPGLLGQSFEAWEWYSWVCFSTTVKLDAGCKVLAIFRFGFRLR